MNAPADAPRARQLKRLAALVTLAVALAACGVGVVSGIAQSAKEERKVEEKIPSHLPIKIKLRKPEKVKDLENDGWIDDLEVEVTNTGMKPIYYLNIALLLPGVITEDGGNIAYTLKYGRSQLYEPEEPVLPDDVPLLPGEATVIKVPVDRVDAWKSLRAKGKLANPKKIEFWFQTLKFGDGTGLWTLDGIPYPKKKEHSYNTPLGRGKRGLDKVATNSPPEQALSFASAFTPHSSPVNFTPAIFFSCNAAKSSVGVDICCPGMGPNCSHLKLKMINCICGEVDGSESASCSDPFGECAQTESARDTCRDSTGFVHYCDRPVIGPPCNSATPTPTPTPSPTPPSSGCSADPRPACPHYACNYDTGRWECRGTSLDARAGRV